MCTSTQAPVCTHVFIGAHILESQKRTSPLTEGWVIASQGLRLFLFNANPKEGTGALALDGQNVPLALETACPGMQAILSFPKCVMQIGVHPVGRHDPGSSSDKNLGICLLSRRPMITLSPITFPGQQPLPSRKTFPEPPVNGYVASRTPTLRILKELGSSRLSIHTSLILGKARTLQGSSQSPFGGCIGSTTPV